MEKDQNLSHDEIKIFNLTESNKKKMIKKDISIDILTFLVAKKLTNDFENNKSKKSPLRKKLGLIGLLVFIICLVIGFISNRKDSDNSRYKKVNDPSIFSTVNYFGKEDVIQTLVGRITRIITLIKKKDPKLLSCKLSPVKKNYLFYGDPGTGKTLLVKRLAFLLDQNLKLFELKKKKVDINKISQPELHKKLKGMKPKVRLISIQPSSLNDRYVGGTEQNIQKLWEEAKKDKKSDCTIIFMDEIESFLSKRKDENTEHSTNVKSEFLCMLDGFRSKLEDKIIFIGATNLPRSLDEAFLRRFHTKIQFNLPDTDERRQLIESFLIHNTNRFSDTEIESLTTLSKGLSQSQIARIFSDAADYSDEIFYSADFEDIETLLLNVKDAGNNVEAELAEINVQSRGMEDNYVFLDNVSF